MGNNAVKVMRPGGLTLTDKMISECSLLTKAKILDMGCGVGTVVHHLISKYDYDAIGIDCSEALIKRGLLMRPELPISVNKAESLPYPNEVMDCVLMECTLSVFQNPEDVLKEAHRVMKLGGKLAISDVYIKNTTSRTSYEGIEEIKQRLKGQGFKTIKWSDQTPYLHSYVAEMIWNQSGDQEYNFLSEFCTLGDISGVKLGYFSLIAEK